MTESHNQQPSASTMPGTSSSASDVDVTGNKSGKIMPSNFITADQCDRDKEGEKLLVVVLKHAKLIGWNKSFGHGSYGKFVAELHLHAFKHDGMLNEFLQPAASTLKNALSRSKKVIEKQLESKHSSNDAGTGESYIDHLQQHINIWNQMKQEAEDATPPTQSQTNRTFQNTVTGQTGPLGSNTNSQPRSSTTKENKRHGLITASRDKTLPGSHSGPSDTPLPATKKPKHRSPLPATKKPKHRSPPNSDVTSVIEEQSSSRTAMATAVAALATNIGGNADKKEGSSKTEELNMQQKMFDHQKSLDAKKEQFEDRKLELQDRKDAKKEQFEDRKLELQDRKLILRYNFKENTENRVVKEAMLSSLKMDYQESTRKLEKCDKENTFLIELYSTEAKDAYAAYRKYQQALIDKTSSA